MGTISKVRGVQGNGHFDGKFGRMFKFEYEFEDGNIMEANHKTEDGFFPVGTEVEYTITRTHERYGNSGKVQKPQEQQGAPAGAAPQSRHSGGGDKNRAFALSYAKDLFVPAADQYTDGKRLAADVIEVADEFLTFLNK